MMISFMYTRCPLFLTCFRSLHPHPHHPHHHHHHHHHLHKDLGDGKFSLCACYQALGHVYRVPTCANRHISGSGLGCCVFPRYQCISPCSWRSVCMCAYIPYHWCCNACTDGLSLVRRRMLIDTTINDWRGPAFIPALCLLLCADNMMIFPCSFIQYFHNATVARL